MSDENNNENKKRVELWEGYWVDANLQLLDDWDFLQDITEAERLQNLPEYISLIFSIVGGEKIYRDVRKHIEAEKGYVSQESLLDIVSKIGSVFPKVGNRAQRRSWQTSR